MYKNARERVCVCVSVTSELRVFFTNSHSFFHPQRGPPHAAYVTLVREPLLCAPLSLAYASRSVDDNTRKHTPVLSQPLTTDKQKRARTNIHTGRSLVSCSVHTLKTPRVCVFGTAPTPHCLYCPLHMATHLSTCSVFAGEQLFFVWFTRHAALTAELLWQWGDREMQTPLS